MKILLGKILRIKTWHIVLLITILYIFALIVCFLPHKKVSSSFQNDFAQMTFLSNTSGSERVAYITDHTDALLYRLRMIEEAKDEIILSTFDFNSDESGKDILAALLSAADRGVKVRVIADGSSGLIDMHGNPYFQALAVHDNIELKRYNPINLLNPFPIQARLHDKYLIIDHTMYLLGGRNTTDLFLGDYPAKKNLDRELFVYTTVPDEENSLMQLREYFENIWSLPESKTFRCQNPSPKVAEKSNELKERYKNLRTLYPSMMEAHDWNDLTMEARKITLLSNPIQAKNKEPHMWYALSELMKQGRDIKIYTPYIICGNEMYADLREICENSERVEIVTNDVISGANPWGCTDYLNQQDKIRATGVHVYEYLGSDSSHTKAYLIDDRLSVIGSYNLDMRSTYLNTELMLAVDSPELNSIIRQEFETDKTFSRTMTPSGEYKMGENYRSTELSSPKKMFYGILRIVITPIRRFL